MRPLPPSTAPATAMVVGWRNDSIARDFPGRAAISVDAALPRFDRLPFDAVELRADIPIEHLGLHAGGFVDIDGVFRRSPRWAWARDYPRWAVSMTRGGAAVHCRGADQLGRRRCGKRIMASPELIEVENGNLEIWGAMQLGRLTADETIEVKLSDVPSGLVGHVIVTARGHTVVHARRGSRTRETPCIGPGVCVLGFPKGEAELIVRVVGPSPPIAVNIRELR